MLTRIAPTPSGFLHIGNVMSFLITQQLAKEQGAKILLRIDDMDQDRMEEKYLQDIFETLHFMEIGWEEGPKDAEDFKKNFSQRSRMHLYNSALEELKNNKRLYACICSRQQLS